MDNYILTATNAQHTLTTFLGGTTQAVKTLGGVPLGAVGDSATGELGTKVILIGSTAGGATYPIPPAVSTYSPSLFSDLGANATLNVKATAGNVFSLACHSDSASTAFYVQLHNTATVPVTGVTIPIYSFLVPPAGQIIIGTDFFTNAGVNFALGIAFAWSTTKDVYTAATATDHSTWIHFK